MRLRIRGTDSANRCWATGQARSGRRCSRASVPSEVRSSRRFGIVIARLVLRLRWLAITVTLLFLSLTAAYDMSVMPLSLVFPLASGALLTMVVIRFGLLSLVVTWFAWGIVGAVPMTLEFSHWRADASNWTLALVIALTLFGFYASRAGQPLLGSILGEER